MTIDELNKRLDALKADFDFRRKAVGYFSVALAHQMRVESRDYCDRARQMIIFEIAGAIAAGKVEDPTALCRAFEQGLKARGL